MVPQVCTVCVSGKVCTNRSLVISVDEAGRREQENCLLSSHLVCSVHQLLLSCTDIGEEKKGGREPLVVGLEEEEEGKRRSCRRRPRPRLLPRRTRRQHISGIGVATNLQLLPT